MKLPITLSTGSFPSGGPYVFVFLAQTPAVDPSGGVYTFIMTYGLPPALLIAITYMARVIVRLYAEKTSAEKDKLKIEKEKLVMEKLHSEKLDDLRERHRTEITAIERERRDYTIKVEEDRRKQSEKLLREQRELVEKSSAAMIEMMSTFRELTQPMPRQVDTEEEDRRIDETTD